LVRKIVFVEREPEGGYVVKVEYRYSYKDFPELAKIVSRIDETEKRIYSYVSKLLNSDTMKTYINACAYLAGGNPFGKFRIVKIYPDHIVLKEGLLGKELVIELQPKQAMNIVRHALEKIRKTLASLREELKNLERERSKASWFKRKVLEMKMEKIKKGIELLETLAKRLESYGMNIPSVVTEMRGELEKLWKELEKLDSEAKNVLEKIRETFEERAPKELKLDDETIPLKEIVVKPNRIAVVYRGYVEEYVPESRIMHITPSDIIEARAATVLAKV